MIDTVDEDFIRYSIKLSAIAQKEGEVPVGAIVVQQGVIIGEGYNRPIGMCDPTAHAEVVALRAAAQASDNYRLVGATLYVTLEPCLMCLGAILHARISRLVFGAYDKRAGMISSVVSHRDLNVLRHKIICEGGVLEELCSENIKNFFKNKRLQRHACG